ncbi:MAG TPA: hypothetical protein VHJ20_12300 [Polyangia bacterium]|nr:hypothetical protein [Polyangia bacterium]
MPPSHLAPAPVELKPATGRRWPEWMRGLLARGAPRARVVAPPEVRLGQAIEIEWGIDCPAGNLASVSVSLVGSEVAHQRISARTGISIVSHTSVFEVRELARAVGQVGVRVAYGRGSGVVPARAVPSFVARHNEIAWAILVAADFRAGTSDREVPQLRESFPLVVRGPA